MLRILLLSTLYPSASRPLHGLFVETRLCELVKSGEVEARVIAPVPWFPLRGAIFGAWGAMAATPAREVRRGLQVLHPRYFLPPKIGMRIAPDMIARAVMPAARALQRDGFDFDLIDAHYYYPDGVAAAVVARALGKPFVVTARGSDLNLIAEFPGPRRRILDTAAQAAASVGVCDALMQKLGAMGAEPAKLNVLRNGVDLEMFAPAPAPAARRRLGLPESGRILLTVGNLVELKGHHLAIEAIAALPADVTLVVVGAGPERARLEALARQRGVAGRVRFAGAVPQPELRWHYAAADALALCSSREGWANVLLEAMACGTPVLATAIPGTTEVVREPAAGRLLRERSAAALAEAWSLLMADPPRREEVRAYAEGFSWDETTRGQIALFRRILAAPAAAA